MSDTVISAIGEMNADTEELCEASKKKYADEYEAVLYGVGYRNEFIFESAGADMDLTIEDYASVPVNERGDDWTSGLTALFAAAEINALVTSGVMMELVKISEKNGEILNEAARKVGTKTLIEAVGKLPGSGATEKARAKRRAKADGQ